MISGLAEKARLWFDRAQAEGHPPPEHADAPPARESSKDLGPAAGPGASQAGAPAQPRLQRDAGAASGSDVSKVRAVPARQSAQRQAGGRQAHPRAQAASGRGTKRKAVRGVSDEDESVPPGLVGARRTRRRTGAHAPALAGLAPLDGLRFGAFAVAPPDKAPARRRLLCAAALRRPRRALAPTRLAACCTWRLSWRR